MAIQLQQGYKTAKKYEKYETPSCVIAKKLNTENKKKTLNFICIKSHIKNIPVEYFSTEARQTKRAWDSIIQIWKAIISKTDYYIQQNYTL